MKIMQKQRTPASQHIFRTTEVAEFAYCPLSWWYEQYEPLAQTDSEELFAHLVALEHEHGPQATSLPDYQVTEQLLMRRGAFDEERGQDDVQTEELAQVQEEQEHFPDHRIQARLLLSTACIALFLALVFLVLSLVQQ